MRALAIASLVLVFACGKRAYDQPRGPRRQIVFEIDLDKAVDDKAWDIKAGLDAAFAEDKVAVVVKITSPGALAIISADAATRPAIDAVVKSNYNDTVVARECDVVDGPTAVCIAIAPAYAQAVKTAALAIAVKTIRARLAEVKVKHPTVVEKGGLIVVEFPEDDEQGMTLRDLIARTGKLEFKVVDDGSEYMKKVFTKVGLERDGAPTDPRAIADKIRAEVDQWRDDEGGSAHADYYLIAHDRAELVPVEQARTIGCVGTPADDGKISCSITGRRALERYIAALGEADPMYKLPDDRELGFERLEPLPDAKDRRPVWRSYLLERTPRLTGKAISNASGSYDPNTNRPIVLLDFNREGTRVFAELTSQIVGKKLAIVLDGRINSAPIINGAIRGGRASIMMGGNTDAARQERERDELVTVLKTGSLPAPLREAATSVVP